MARKSLPKKGLGKKIKKLRLEMGYTQKELAEKADISEKYISNIETGSEPCSLAVLVSLANCLNASMDYLLSGVLTKQDLNINEDDNKTKVVKELDGLNDNQLQYLLINIKALKDYGLY